MRFIVFDHLVDETEGRIGADQACIPQFFALFHNRTKQKKFSHQGPGQVASCGLDSWWLKYGQD